MPFPETENVVHATRVIPLGVTSIVMVARGDAAEVGADMCMVTVFDLREDGVVEVEEGSEVGVLCAAVMVSVIGAALMVSVTGAGLMVSLMT